jgi:hypothetical protein
VGGHRSQAGETGCEADRSVQDAPEVPEASGTEQQAARDRSAGGSEAHVPRLAACEQRNKLECRDKHQRQQRSRMKGRGEPPPLARKRETERDRDDPRTGDAKGDATAGKAPAALALGAAWRLT